MEEDLQMLGNAALMQRPKVAFLSSRRVAPAAVMRIEHDYEFAKRQGPDLSPALHRIAEAQRSVNNPSWGSDGSLPKPHWCCKGRDARCPFAPPRWRLSLLARPARRAGPTI